MKRQWIWSVAAAVFVAAIAVPYIGYLVRGTMPFITDPRGMAGTGLVLGLAAFVAAAAAIRPRQLSRIELGLAAITVVLGLVAVGLAETFAASVLLAVFMGAIVVTGLYLVAHELGVRLPVHHGHWIAH